ncbi:MAG: hypothetical protein ACLTX6_07260 [Lachnospiraceae bacterium]
MIKVEKKGNTTKATVEGSTYVLVDEFQTVLHALYHMLDKSIKESESVTTLGFYAFNGRRCGAERKRDE